jgi:cell division protein FtsL
MKKKIYSVLLIIMPVIVGILMTLEIISINQFAGSGKEIQTINDRIASLNQENTLIEERIASYSSFRAIADRAGQLGFKTPVSNQYETILPDQLPVALKTSP